jgi:hypothetical protein
VAEDKMSEPRRWAYVDPDKQFHADVARIEALQQGVFSARVARGDAPEQAKRWMFDWQRSDLGALGEEIGDPAHLSGHELRQWWIRLYERMTIAAAQPEHAEAGEA